MKVEKYKFGFTEIDLEEDGDLFLLPAFTDSHIHLRALLSSQYIVNLEDDSLIENLESSSKEICIGRGWKKDFDYHILEKIDRPALAIRVCGHKAYCNDGFKREFKLESNIVTENNLVDLFTVLDDLILTKESLKIAEESLKRKGIYRVIDMGTTPKLLEILKDGTLDYNLFFDLPYKDFLISNGFRFKDKISENVKVLGLKTYLDGSLGANTASLFSNDVLPNYTDEELFKIFKDMDDRGLAVAAHAIGDRAVNQFVKIAKNLKNKFHKIEHCQIVKREDIEYLLNPGIQPYFYVSDRLWVNSLNLESSMFYPLKSLIERKPLGGSDFPVESFDPFQSIRAAIMRVDGEGLDLESAIDMYTKNPDFYLEESLDKWILVKDFYSSFPTVIKEIKL